MFVQADLKDLLALRKRRSSDSVRSASTRTTVSQFQRSGSGNKTKFVLCQTKGVANSMSFAGSATSYDNIYFKWFVVERE